MTAQVSTRKNPIAETWRLYATLLVSAWKALRRAGWKLFSVMLAFYVFTLVVSMPLIGWLFREALRANGMVAVDFGNLSVGRGIGVSLLLLVLLGLVAFWSAAIQFVVLIVMLRRAQNGHSLTVKAVWADSKHIFRKLFRASSFPLVLYLFVVLPLTGFGFVDTLASQIAVPQFISGELMKDTTTAVLWVALMVVLFLANVKFALSLPIFATTNATGSKAMHLSWRLMGLKSAIALMAAVATVIAGAALFTSAFAFVVALPTVAADAWEPTIAPTTASFGLSAAHVLAAFVVGVTTAAVLALALVLTELRAGRMPAAMALAPLAPNTPTHVSNRSAGWILLGTGVAVTAFFGFTSISTMESLAQQPATLILAHRGYVDGGVENSISALEAAAAANADIVEMDVMQTKDGEFVVIHDPSLSRLAGVHKSVKDMTLEELTAVEIHDHFGHVDTIPSLEEYVLRAKELGMPLLIEIKMGGLDSEDHVEKLVAQLEEIGGMEGNIFHSLDPKSVETLKALRPDTTVGYIMPFAGEGLPETSADFIVVEEWTATKNVQAAAADAGLGFVVWTVDDPDNQREKLRRGVHGIITDKPVQALASRESMREETGMTHVLLDIMTSFLTF